jgi:branched-subunit amino acid aminotransferase/4-amino-4-deoxychorismate lyase
VRNTAPPAALPAADAVFLTLTTQGVTEAVALDGQPLNRSPLVAALHRAYWALVDQDSNEDREGAEDWDQDEEKD